MDKAVDTLVGEAGHITAKLGLAANTLILFASDNGPSIRWGLAAGSGKIVMLALSRSTFSICSLSFSLTPKASLLQWGRSRGRLQRWKMELLTPTPRKAPRKSTNQCFVDGRLT